MGAIREEFLVNAQRVIDTERGLIETRPFELLFDNPILFEHPDHTHSEIYINEHGGIDFIAYQGDGVSWSMNEEKACLYIFQAYTEFDDTNPEDLTYNRGFIDGHKVLVFNFMNAINMYGPNSALRNDMQLVLIDRSDIAPGDWDWEFNYNKVQWDQIDQDSGYLHTFIGWTFYGDFWELNWPAANTGLYDDLLFPDISCKDTDLTYGLIYNKRNSDVNGRYVFNVRDGKVQRDLDLIVSGGVDSNQVYTIISLFNRADEYPETEYDYTYSWQNKSYYNGDIITNNRFSKSSSYYQVDPREIEDPTEANDDYAIVQLTLKVDNGIDPPVYFLSGVTVPYVLLIPREVNYWWYDEPLEKSIWSTGGSTYTEWSTSSWLTFDNMPLPNIVDVYDYSIDTSYFPKILAGPEGMKVEPSFLFEDNYFSWTPLNNVSESPMVVIEFTLTSLDYDSIPFIHPVTFVTAFKIPVEQLCNVVPTIREAHKTEFLRTLNDISYKGIAQVPSTPISPTLGISFDPIPISKVDEDGNCICPPVIEFIEKTS